MISDKKEQIYDTLKEERRPISQRELTFLTGIDSIPLGRYINKLIEEKKISKFFMAISEEEESSIYADIGHLRKDTKAWRIYDTLRKAKVEMSHQELERIVGFRIEPSRAGLNRYLERGLIIKRKLGLKNYYHVPGVGTFEKTIEQTFNRDKFINKIEPLRNFIEYLTSTSNYSPESIRSYARNIIFFYKFKSGLDSSQLTVCPPESFQKEDIKNFIDYCKDRNCSVYRLNGLLVTLRAYFKFLSRSDLIPRNLKIPKDFMARPKKVIEVFCDRDKEIINKRKCYRCKHYFHRSGEKGKRAKCHFNESYPESISEPKKIAQDE